MRNLKTLFIPFIALIIGSSLFCTLSFAQTKNPASFRLTFTPSLSTNILTVYSSNTGRYFSRIRNYEYPAYAWPVIVVKNAYEHIFVRPIYDVRFDFGLRVIYKKSESQLSIGTMLTRVSLDANQVYNAPIYNLHNYRYYSFTHQHKLIKFNSILFSVGGLIQLDKYESKMLQPISKGGWVYPINQFNTFMIGLYPELRWVCMDYWEFNVRMFPIMAFSKLSGYHNDVQGNLIKNSLTDNFLSYRTSLGMSIIF